MMRVPRGQTILEYTMIVSILTVVLFYMGTSIKRGVQSLVKVTADQVGSQQNSDQDFNDAQSGYMIRSNTVKEDINKKETKEIGYIAASGNAVYLTNTSYNEATITMTNTL